MPLSQRGGEFSFSLDADYWLSARFAESTTLAEGVNWAFRFELLLSLLVGKASIMQVLTLFSLKVRGICQVQVLLELVTQL